MHTENKEVDIFDSVPTENLVWAQPCIPIFGGVSQVGMYGVPCQGAHVFVFFENGNIMQPRFFATAPGIPRVPANPKWGFHDPDGKYPLETSGKPDWNKGDATANYGDVFILEDKGGNRIIFDSTEGAEQIIIQNGGEVRAKQTIKQGSIRKQSGNGTDITQTGAQKTTVSGDSEYIVNGKNIISSNGAKKSVLGDNKEYIAGPSDTTVTGIENRNSGGLTWNVKGDSNVMTAGDASYVADSTLKLKSNTTNIKLEATLMNIEMQALLGKVGSTSMTIDMLATTMATFKGMVMTTVGGGLITKVDGMVTTVNGSSICQITGGMIMIG